MMIKTLSLTLAIIWNCFLCFEAVAQPKGSDRPSGYKISWQRLLLRLSTGFCTAAEENQVDLDSNLIYCARSFGLSRMPVIAEGIDVRDLNGQLQWIDQRTPEVGLQQLSGSSGRKHLELLVLLGAYYAFEPDNYRLYKDRALYFLDQAITESKTQHEPQLGLQARLLIGKMYDYGYDFQHSDPIFDDLIKDCQAAGDKVMEAKAWNYRGLYTGYSTSTIARMLNSLQHARRLYHEQHNTEGEINTLTAISYLNVPNYQLEKAYTASLEALRLIDSVHFPFTQYNLDAVAMITSFDGKLGEPLAYALESVRVAETVQDGIGLGYLYDRIGLLYYTEDVKHEGVQKWYEKAVITLMKAHQDIGLYRVVSNLVHSFLAAGNPEKALHVLTYVPGKMPPKTIFDKLYYNLAFASYYTKTGNYDLAQQYLVTADSLEKQLEKNGNDFRHASIPFAYGELNYYRGNYAGSRDDFERYLSDPSRMSSTMVGEVIALRYLINIDSIQGNKSLEIRHHRLYEKLADSNYKISKMRQAEELQVKYATAEKENQIKLLSQTAKLEQANLNKTTLVKNVTIAGIVLVIVIAGLLFRQNRLRKKSNEVLEQLLSEKEWLLKEVHHRVKNNLHTVMCLLESQELYLENDALEAIGISQRRIYAMSLIHQKLYQSEDIELVDMSLYIKEFVQYLADSFGAPANISIRSVVQPAKLGISQAIPLGLILNEAVTNAFKYAFPDNRPGEIFIGLRKAGNHMELVIADNGIGMQRRVEESEPLNSLGIELMRGLTRDLKGDITFDTGAGTRINVAFALALKQSSTAYDN